ncbi:MAG: hypothetical protein K2H41_03210 [Acetatifactor sp.]|nr:hypothetical protein [Acetatifactor sp.]
MENNLDKKSIFSNGLNTDIPVAIMPEHRYNGYKSVKRKSFRPDCGDCQNR